MDLSTGKRIPPICALTGRGQVPHRPFRAETVWFPLPGAHAPGYTPPSRWDAEPLNTETRHLSFSTVFPAIEFLQTAIESVVMRRQSTRRMIMLRKQYMAKNGEDNLPFGWPAFGDHQGAGNQSCVGDTLATRGAVEHPGLYETVICIFRILLSVLGHCFSKKAQEKQSGTFRNGTETVSLNYRGFCGSCSSNQHCGRYSRRPIRFHLGVRR